VDSPEVKHIISPRIQLKKVNNRSNDKKSKFIAPAVKKDYLKFNSKNFREDYYCKSSFPSGSFIRQTFSMQPRSVPPMVSKPEKN
jgi:hypothetical protein